MAAKGCTSRSSAAKRLRRSRDRPGVRDAHVDGGTRGSAWTVSDDNTGGRTATVIVPLDGSEEATAALPVARTLAQAEGVPLHLLHVGEQAETTRVTLQAI